MSTANKDLIDLYDLMASKAKPQIGWGLRVYVKIGDREVETEQIPPAAARSSFQQGKPVKKEALQDALSGYQNKLKIEETATELLITPTMHLGNDWDPINLLINGLADSKKTWVSEADRMKSHWAVKKA